MADAKGQRQNVHQIVAKRGCCVSDLNNPDCKDNRNNWVGSMILFFFVDFFMLTLPEIFPVEGKG